MSKMYLVQRGSFNDIKNITNSGVFGRDNMIHLDYMGSAEFEWGAIPRSINRMAKNQANGSFIIKDTGMKSVNGKSLFIACDNEETFEKAKNEIQKYLKDCADIHSVRKYVLKEYILFEYKMLEWYNKKSNSYERRFDFWFDIENDFMFFLLNEKDERFKMFSERIIKLFDGYNTPID